MDIHEIRLTNLQWIIDHYYPRKRARLAREIGRRQNELWRLFSQDPRYRRNVGDELARAIERHMGYPCGWLDQRHLFEDGPVPGRSSPTADPRPTEPKNVVILNPAGHKCVAILNYREAAAWADTETPYPITAKTETMWVLGEDISPMAIGLRIEGASMLDLFYPGDIVIIDRCIEPTPDDYVGAKLVDATGFVFAKYKSRQVGPRASGMFELIPENPDHPAILVNRSNPGRIVGTMAVHYRLRRRMPRQEGPVRAFI